MPHIAYLANENAYCVIMLRVVTSSYSLHDYLFQENEERWRVEQEANKEKAEELEVFREVYFFMIFSIIWFWNFELNLR